MNANQGTAQSPNQRNDRARVERSINMAEIALRGASTLIDIQLAGWRNLAQMHARSATMFGLPECTEWFNAADKLVKSQLSATTDQLLNSTRQLSQAYSETNRQFGRMVQQSTAQLAEELRKGVEEVGQRTRQSMQELTNMAERQASEAEREMESAQQRNGDAQARGDGQGAGQEEKSEMQFRQPDEGARKGAAQQQPRKN